MPLLNNSSNKLKHSSSGNMYEQTGEGRDKQLKNFKIPLGTLLWLNVDMTNKNAVWISGNDVNSIDKMFTFFSCSFFMTTLLITLTDFLFMTI